MTEHELIVRLCTLILDGPDDHVARMRWIDDTDDPSRHAAMHLRLTCLGYVQAELGDHAVRRIRAKHRRIMIAKAKVSAAS